jgi:hypothetical protein
MLAMLPKGGTCPLTGLCGFVVHGSPHFAGPDLLGVAVERCVADPQAAFPFGIGVVHLGIRTFTSALRSVRSAILHPPPAPAEIEGFYKGDYHIELRKKGASERQFGDNSCATEIGCFSLSRPAAVSTSGLRRASSHAC